MAITTGGVSVTQVSVAAVSGVATFTSLGLNALVGTYTLTFSDTTDSAATVTSAPITVTVGAAKALALGTAPAAGAVSGVALTPQPVVDVVDSGGNTVPTDTSTVTAAYTGAGSTLTNNTKAAVAGVAAFNGLTITAPIDTTSGVLNFTDGTLTLVSSVSISITGPGTKLAIVTAPSTSAVNGAALPIQPVISVEDASGAVLKGDTSTVTAALVGGNAGSSITNSTKVAVLGEASFTGLAINAAPGSYYIIFTDGSLTAVTTTLQTTVAIGAPAKLVITTEPSNFTGSGVVLAQQPVVKIEDSGGNVVTTFATGAVTASISTGVGGALSAGSSANFVAGVATFSGLTLTGVAGTSYTLTYSGDSFNVVDTTAIKVGQTQAALVISNVNATYGRPFTLVTTGGSGTGALSFVVANGTATGCTSTGTTLTSTTAGTCIVTATKASDGTYATVSSSATTVAFAKLPIPGAVRVTFTKNSAALTGAARTAIIVLVRKLTVHSVVSITGYAKGNTALAQHRAVAAETYLIQRLHLHVQLHWNTKLSTQSALLTTKSQ